MKNKFVAVLAALALILGLALGSGYHWLSSYLKTPLNVNAPVEVQLRPGTSLSHFARQLEAQQILSHARIFSLYARYRDLAQSVKAGEYRLVPGMTPQALLEVLVSGKVVHYQVTLVEGKTLREWRDVLAAQPRLAQIVGELSDEQLLKRIGAEETHPEGLFYPDTYSYQRGDSDLSILKRAYARMQEVLAEEWDARAEGLPLATPYEALILASIVERETGAPEERSQIAGVFVRRLHKGMRLQTDPTVIYGMGERFKGNLRRRDLLEMTPYNTYRIDGLPPTPIAMPGRAAIHAALHPDSGDALYFVARGDGSHQFSVTLAEHNRAVREYQIRKRRTDYRSSPPPAPAQEKDE